MNARLDTLLRQRELLREHLRWLDSEIAAVGGSQETAAPRPQPSSVVASVPTIATGPRANAEVTATPEILPEIDSRSIHEEVRRGCLIYAAIAFAGIVAIVAFAYWKH